MPASYLADRHGEFQSRLVLIVARCCSVDADVEIIDDRQSRLALINRSVLNMQDLILSEDAFLVH